MRKFRYERIRVGEKNVYLVSYYHGMPGYRALEEKDEEELNFLLSKIRGKKLFLQEGYLRKNTSFRVLDEYRQIAQDTSLESLPFVKSGRSPVFPLEPVSLSHGKDLTTSIDEELASSERQWRAARYTGGKWIKILENLRKKRISRRELSLVRTRFKDPLNAFRSLIFADTILSHVKHSEVQNIIVFCGLGHHGEVKSFLTKPELRSKMLAAIPKTASFLKTNRRINRGLISQHYGH